MSKDIIRTNGKPSGYTQLIPISSGGDVEDSYGGFDIDGRLVCVHRDRESCARMFRENVAIVREFLSVPSLNRLPSIMDVAPTVAAI